MKKHLRLIDPDRANYVAKVEAVTEELDGVHDVIVSPMIQKLTLDTNDTRFDETLNEVVKACKKVEPDCIIVR